MGKDNFKVAVFGSSQPRPGTKRYEEARLLGRALAEAGWTIVSGGYHGVMEAASRGAKEGGGKTIGITTAFFGKKGLKPNEYIDTEIQTPTYAERLLKLTEISDGYVIMRGGSGTLNELFFSWELPDELSFSSPLDLLEYASEPEKAVEIIKNGIELIWHGNK